MTDRPPFTTRWVLRTLQRIRQLAAIPADDLARRLSACLTAGDVLFLATYLSDTAEYMAPLENIRKCSECGTDLDSKFTRMRPDAKHCSDKSRQRAYRKRATARLVDTDNKRNKRAFCNGSHAGTAGRNVTHQDAAS